MSIRRSDILFYAGGECLRRFGVPVMGFSGRQRGALSVARTGDVGTVIDRNGQVRSATANRLRYAWLDLDGDGERETLALLVEPARTNAVSAAITSWSITNSGTWTGTTTGPDGVAGSGKGIAHGSGGVQVRANNIPTGTPTNNAVQAVSVFAKAADVDWCFIRANRKDAATPWVYFDIANGVLGTADPGITGYIDGPYFGDYWRCQAWFDVLSGGSTAQWEIGPADADGDPTMAGAGAPYVYFFAPCWEMNGRRPSSPLLTSGAARGAETVSFQIGSKWRAMSIYVKSVELGTAADASGFLWRLGAAGALPRATIVASGGVYLGQHAVTGNNNSTLAAAPGHAKVVEHLLTIDEDGLPTLYQSIDGAAQTAGSGGAETDFAAGRVPLCYLGALSGNGGLNPIISSIGVKDVRSMDDMRRVFA